MPYYSHDAVPPADAVYRSVEELTAQLEGGLAGHAGSTAATAASTGSAAELNVAEVIALYLRQERHAIQCGRGSFTHADEPSTSTAADAASLLSSPFRGGRNRSSSSSVACRSLASFSPKLLLLGDDAVVQELASTLRGGGGPPPVASLDGRPIQADTATPPLSLDLPAPLPVRGGLTDTTTTTTSQPTPPLEVYTVPRAVPGLDALQAELCRWCDLVLLCYRCADPASFLRLQDETLPAVRAAVTADEVATMGARPRHAIPTPGPPLPGWPSVPCPVLLVGLGAEARLRRPTDLQAPWITNAEVLAFAAAAGVHRAVELFTGNARHRDIVVEHCRTLREVGYESLASPAAQARRAAAKEAGLHALLRAPPPVVEVRPGARVVHVRTPARVPEARGDGGVRGACVCRCVYTVEDAGDDVRGGHDTGAGAPHVAPADGVLHFADLYAAYTQSTGRPVQAAAAIVLRVRAVVPYLYPSEEVEQRLPTPLAPPTGYVDVVRRACHLALPRGVQQQPAAPLRVAYTLTDGASAARRRTVEVAGGAHVQDVLLPLDSDGDRSSGGGSGGLWRPSPASHVAAHYRRPRSLRAVIESSESAAAVKGAQHPAAETAPLTSTPLVLTVPPVLPPPAVDVRVLEGVLRLQVPGFRPDQVEIRYTLDGTTVPTHQAGTVYSGPVYLDRRTLGTHVHVRAAAYPKLYLASPEAHAHVDLTAAPSAPPLQADEHLDPVRVHWGSPDRVSAHHTPHRPQPHTRGAGDGLVRSSPRRVRTPRTPLAAPAAPSPPQARWSSAQERSARRSNTSHGSWADDREASLTTTRTAQLRQAFNAGLYTPPRHPFLQGEGFTSPRAHGRWRASK